MNVFNVHRYRWMFTNTKECTCVASKTKCVFDHWHVFIDVSWTHLFNFTQSHPLKLQYIHYLASELMAAALTDGTMVFHIFEHSCVTLGPYCECKLYETMRLDNHHQWKPSTESRRNWPKLATIMVLYCTVGVGHTNILYNITSMVNFSMVRVAVSCAQNILLTIIIFIKLAIQSHHRTVWYFIHTGPRIYDSKNYGIYTVYIYWIHKTMVQEKLLCQQNSTSVSGDSGQRKQKTRLSWTQHPVRSQCQYQSQIGWARSPSKRRKTGRRKHSVRGTPRSCKMPRWPYSTQRINRYDHEVENAARKSRTISLTNTLYMIACFEKRSVFVSALRIVAN